MPLDLSEYSQPNYLNVEDFQHFALGGDVARVLTIRDVVQEEMFDVGTRRTKTGYAIYFEEFATPIVATPALCRCLARIFGEETLKDADRSWRGRKAQWYIDATSTKPAIRARLCAQTRQQTPVLIGELAPKIKERLAGNGLTVDQFLAWLQSQHDGRWNRIWGRELAEWPKEAMDWMSQCILEKTGKDQ